MQRPVMIIDDSPVTRKILEVSLQRKDIPWLSFSNGMAVLSALGQQPDLVPAVVLLDIDLPDMDGFTVARCLRSSRALDTMAIVILTAYDGILNRLKARLIGAACYVTKPFKVQEIIAIVSRYVRVPDAPKRLLEYAQAGEYHECTDDALCTSGAPTNRIHGS